MNICKMNKIKKLSLTLLTLAMVLGLVLTFASPVLALVKVSMTGAVWTTDSTGETVNKNIYEAKEDVYLNAGPDNKNKPGLPAGKYYVQVTTPDGDILGKTLTASVTVGSDGEILLVQLWSILYRPSSGFTITGYDNTTNNGGEYKVWVSQDSTFPNNESKTDNFKVKSNLGTIIVVKNTHGGDAYFEFTTTGGSGLPDGFSITTSGNTGLAIYDVAAGTYGIVETPWSGWELTSSSVSPSSAENPGKLTVASDSTVTVTFNNKAKPSYPTPELPTILLFGMGLLGLAGFITIKGRTR